MLAIIGTVVVAGAPAPSGASGADGRPAVPRIRVEPAGRLRDFTRATVSGAGFTPGGRACGGWSAGAVTASNLAYLPGQRGPAGSPVAAAVPIAGWFVRPDQPLPVAGPFAVPDSGEPPSIVFHGSEGQLLPWGSPRDLCPLAAAADIACEYVGFDGAAHDIHISRRREVVRRTFDFLAENVLGPRGIR